MQILGSDLTLNLPIALTAAHTAVIKVDSLERGAIVRSKRLLEVHGLINSVMPIQDTATGSFKSSHSSLSNACYLVQALSIGCCM